MARRPGRLGACLEVRGDCSVWEVEVDGSAARAVAYASLTGSLRLGDCVLLNTTAVELALGTGGSHFVVGLLDGAQEMAEPFPGREAGHIMKLRYTPLQHRVVSVEEEASPHRQAMLAFGGLEGTPVLAAELLSQAAAAALAARVVSPDLRVAFVQLDSAALPLAFSRLVARLRADGVLAATVTVGQGFGGDLEAVNVYTGLTAAVTVAGAELVIVGQGPGNVGTGTRLGFSGMSLVEALHAADFLGGRPILVPRLSQADPRPRHRGVSHHTRALLEAARVSVTVPWPASGDAVNPPDSRPEVAHSFPVVDAFSVLTALKPYQELLTTMGRTLDEDPLFFRAAAAAGVWAAEAALGRREGDHA